jgi:hypothetical protein
MIKRYFTYSLFLSAIFLSCNKDLHSVSCIDCVFERPVEIRLEVTIDIYKDGMYLEPYVKIYEGNLEDSILVAAKSSSTNPVFFMVNINKKYTVTATYYYYHYKTYTVVDSVLPGFIYDTKKCDRPCYFIKNNTINLKLKYT